jgi:uncharacterized membrane protein YeaQ/YmgE (transglycosylase-associated protein family)
MPFPTVSQKRLHWLTIMKMTTQSTKRSGFGLAAVGVLWVSTILCPVSSRAAEDAEQATAAVSSAVEETRVAVVDGLDALWHRVDESRLKNRTPDEIVAWVIMGVLVGAVAGMMTSLKTDGMGKLGRLLLGLGGAFLGGMIVKVAQLDFGWGPVLIRYEELLFSMLGAVVLVIVGRVIRARSRKRKPVS